MSRPDTERGFDGRLDFGARPALIVIDFVNAYVKPGSPLCADYEAQRLACIELLAAARKAGIFIVHTNLSYEPGGADGGIFFKKLPALRCFEQGVHPELVGFVTGLEPLPTETVITKQYASAFFNTPLDAMLRERGIDTLLISGVSTSGCIRATAVDCVQHGFIPIVVRDAVGDRNPASHEVNLFDLQAKYAEVVPLTRVLEYLNRLGTRG